jgi:putative hydrolase of the HAD superfamily
MEVFPCGPIRAVLFDFYGTLTHAVRRGPQHAAVARSLGCELADLATVLDQSFYPRSRGVHGSSEASLRWVCQQLGVRPSRSRLRAAMRLRLGAMRADTRLRTEAVPALTWLQRRGLATAVVSDCTQELPAILPDLPVWPLIGATAYSVQVGQCKPNPEIYLTACRQLSVAPEQCLYVGDGGSRELTGASALGMTAVRLTAPDLAGHLVFNADAGWAGREASTLLDAVGYTLAG